MSQDEMINQIMNNVINEIGILICYNSQWRTKPSENMVI